MSDLLSHMLASQQSRAMLVDWLQLSAAIIKALDAPDPDGKAPLSLYKVPAPPVPDDDEDDEDDSEDTEIITPEADEPQTA